MNAPVAPDVGKLFRVELDSAMFLETDAEGRELLNFGLTIGRRQVTVRPPPLRIHRTFYQRCMVVFEIMRIDADEYVQMLRSDIDLPKFDSLDYDADYHSLWLDFTRNALANKVALERAILEAFVCLRPRVSGLPGWLPVVRWWVRRTASVTDVARMLAACLCYEAWQKKTSNEILNRGFRYFRRPVSEVESLKSVTSVSTPSPNGATSAIDVLLTT